MVESLSDELIVISYRAIRSIAPRLGLLAQQHLRARGCLFRLEEGHHACDVFLQITHDVRLECRLLPALAILEAHVEQLLALGVDGGGESRSVHRGVILAGECYGSRGRLGDTRHKSSP